jgi:hypothetical protein
LYLWVFSSTDPKLIEELSLELKKMAPQAKIDTGRNSVDMKNIKNQWEVYWWLITYLCDQGWEPFSATHHLESRENHFRFEYEE